MSNSNNAGGGCTGNKETKDAEEQKKKVVTKYDRKVQRRKEQKAKDERDRKIGMITGIVIVAALVCFIASFPIRTFLTLNGAYITVDGEKVSRVEYDYYYNISMNNYLSGDGAWLYYAGLDLSGDLSQQMYSEDMSFKDFFDEMAVDLIKQNKALAKEARGAGFEFDTDGNYKEYMETLREYVSEEGITAKAYLSSMYGPYATESRIKPYVKELMYANAYYESIVSAMTFTQDEIQQYYDEHKNSYDLVDYRLSTVSAELPKEPTELADPVETAAPAEGTEGGEAGEYEPSEAEIAKAMEIAKTEADKLEKTVKTEGEQTTGVAYSDLAYLLRDWMFSEERKAGDTTVIEDTANNRYYVLAFEKRYRTEAVTADARVVTTSSGNGQEILDEWKSGEATEESFAQLCDKYNDPTFAPAEGGLYKELFVSRLSGELKEWISDSSRAAGDTAVISPAEDTYSYVIYYIAPGRAEWIVDIENMLKADQASEYIEKLIENVSVEDKKGNLNYLKVYAQREENAGSEGNNSPEDTTPTEAPGEQ